MRRTVIIVTCLGGGAPSIPAPLPAPEQQDPAVVAGRDADLKRRRAAASNTFLTSYYGKTPTAPVGKTMLGM